MDRRTVAAGILDGTATPAAWVAGARGGFTSTVTDNGTGDWTINMDSSEASIPATANGGWGVNYSVIGTAARICVFERVSATSLRVRCFDAATPTAADAVVNLEVYRY